MTSGMKKSIAVIGGCGGLGSSVLRAFRHPEWTSTSVDFRETTPDLADQGIVLDRKSHWIERTNVLMEQLNNQGFDVVIGAAGSWAGGELGDPVTLQSMEDMWTANVQSAIMTSHLAANLLKPNGLVVLTGALAALEPTPSMAAYGISKAATHHLVSSLAQTLKDSSAIAMLPATLDTPANRQAMPDADRSSWTNVDEIASQYKKWSDDESSRPDSGSLVSVVTTNNVTEWKIL